MSDIQQGDVLLYQTVDGGDLNISGGLVEMTGTFDTAAYISLFGGNYEDAGGSDRTLQWWGNISETNAVKRQISETQHLLESIPLTTGNLKRVEDAARRDLAWFISEGIASAVVVVGSIPALNTIQLDISITAEGNVNSFTFVENWEASIA